MLDNYSENEGKSIILITLNAYIYLFKVNNRNTKKRNEICSSRSGVFIVNSEYISHPFLNFLLLTLNR